MTGELFEVPESLSPKLAWMQKHGVITYHHKMPGFHKDQTWFAGLQSWWPDLSGIDFFATETATNGGNRVGEGESEDEALCDFILWLRVPHWTISGTDTVPNAQKNREGSA